MAPQVNAFALDANSKDAALLLTLPPGAYTVNVTPDLPPDVEIVQPMEDEKATVRKRLMVKYHATDDYGLSEASLVYSVNDGAPQKWKIADLGDRKVEIGMPVEMVTRKIRSDGDERGMLVYGYKFRPVLRN